MNKRFTFKCWNCLRTYTLFREISWHLELIVACPYCNEEAVVDLTPFRKKTKAVVRDEETEQSFGIDLQLPDVLLAQKPE